LGVALANGITYDTLMAVQAFVAGVIVKVLSDPKVQQIVKDLLGELITERIVPLVPLAVASATKAITEALPDIPTAIIGDVAETIRTDLNAVLPDLDIGIPMIDNFLDAWRPK
jgi:hypothetical protein